MNGHWRPVLVQALIFVGMSVVALLSPTTYVTLIALTLVALPVATWTVFFVLLWTSRQATDIASLHEAVDDALTMSVNSTMAAVLGLLVLGRQAGFIQAPIGTFVTLALGYVVVAMSIPALRKLRVWRDVWVPIIRSRKE